MLKSHPVASEPITPAPRRAPAEAEVVTSAKEPSLDELRARLDARESGIRDHLAGLKAELTTLDDLTVGGRPLLGHVRASPVRAVAYTAAAGLVVGVLSGLAARRHHEEASDEEQTIRLLTTALLDDAATHVARGDDTQTALRRAARRHAPTVYYAPQPEVRGTIRETFDLAVKSAIGFGVKMALDMLSERLTGTPEVFTAAEEAADHPPV